MREIKFIVVHCSATPEGKKFVEKDIEAMHALRFKAIGGKHIGYHLLVYLDARRIDGKAGRQICGSADGIFQ